MSVPPANAYHTAIRDACASALRQAEIRLPDDVKAALSRALAAETNTVARGEMENILSNIRVAEEKEIPLCQDTGVPIVYLTLPPEIPLSTEIYEAIADGVRRATADVPLRPNVVDPISRQNTEDNCGDGMPAVHVSTGADFTLTVLPKGAGAENMSRIAMLLPSEKGKIERFVAETMLIAGGRPCPPVILGVGIGSTFDGVAALAKEALLEPIDQMDPFEQQLCDAVNRLGIGPMGLGGDTTALAVKVKTAACHTAALPVAVNVQCWAARRVTRRVEVRP